MNKTPEIGLGKGKKGKKKQKNKKTYDDLVSKCTLSVDRRGELQSNGGMMDSRRI